MQTDFNYTAALYEFQRARNQAMLKELLSRLTGESTQLLSFDEVRQTLKLGAGAERGLQDIPLEAIVGSLGRYNDFTRDFLPRMEASAERWARVKALATSLEGLPPIDVYQIGEVYFVKDGNHRVSVARQMGASHIHAYVTEVQSRVPLTPDIQPDDLIIKAEYAGFLEQTQLDRLRPEANLSVSVPGRYPELLEHIDVHRYYMGHEHQREIPYQKAVAHWYDKVYLPVVETIRALGILRDFPERTETDLYLWVARYRSELEQKLGWKIQTEYAAADLAARLGEKRIGGGLLSIVIPESLEAGPPPGEWRAQAQAVRPEGCLIVEALVPLSGQEDGWNALEQAMLVARREGASLQGLHVVPAEQDTEAQAAQAVRAEFKRRCQQAGISGALLVVSGTVAQQVCKYAAWSDLIIANLAHPPGERVLARLGSGFRRLIQRCPRPVLATPSTVSPLEHALLAYDGSAKSREGLYIAAYLAGKWGIRLTVACVLDNGRTSEETLAQAQQYLQEHGILATYLAQRGPVADSLLNAAQAHGCDFFIMGGYGLSPVLEVVLGSTVDQVLRESAHPVLICR